MNWLASPRISHPLFHAGTTPPALRIQHRAVYLETTGSASRMYTIQPTTHSNCQLVSIANNKIGEFLRKLFYFFYLWIGLNLHGWIKYLDSHPAVCTPYKLQHTQIVNWCPLPTIKLTFTNLQITFVKVQQMINCNYHFDNNKKV